LFETKHPALKICRYSIIGLTYLKRQNSGKSERLLFAATTKRYAAFFRMFLQPLIHRKTAPLPLKKNITKLRHNRLKQKAIQNIKAYFSLSILTIHIF